MSAAPADRLKAAAGTLVGLARRAAGKRILRDGLWIGAGHATMVLAGLISIRVFTELAPAAVFGGANLLLGALTLGMSALLSPITQTQVRYYMQHHLEGHGGAYTRIIARWAAGSVFLLALTASLALLLWPALRVGASPWLIPLVALWAGASAARSVLISPLQAQRRMKRYAAWVGAEAVLLLVGTALALKLHPSIEAFIAGQAAAACIGILAFGRLPRTAQNPVQRTGVLRDAREQILRYGLPFLPFALLGFAYGQADRFVLAANLDAAVVGQYAAAFAIASRIPGLAGGIMTDIFRPILFEAETKGDWDRGRRIFRAWIGAMMLVCGTLALTVFLFGGAIAEIFLAAPYRTQAREIMTLVTLGFGFNAVAQVMENRIFSFGASRTLIWTKLAAGGANIACAFALIPVFGIIGAGAANLLGQAVLFVATGFALTRMPHAEASYAKTSEPRAIAEVATRG